MHSLNSMIFLRFAKCGATLKQHSLQVSGASLFLRCPGTAIRSKFQHRLAVSLAMQPLITGLPRLSVGCHQVAKLYYISNEVAHEAKVASSLWRQNLNL